MSLSELVRLRKERDDYIDFATSLDAKIRSNQLTFEEHSSLMYARTKGLSHKKYLYWLNSQIDKHELAQEDTQAKVSFPQAKPYTIAAALTVIFLLFVFASLSPSFTGLATYGKLESFTIEMNSTFEAGLTEYPLGIEKGTLRSLRISGIYQGEFNIWLVKNDSRYLVYGSSSKGFDSENKMTGMATLDGPSDVQIIENTSADTSVGNVTENVAINISEPMIANIKEANTTEADMAKGIAETFSENIFTNTSIDISNNTENATGLGENISGNENIFENITEIIAINIAQEHQFNDECIETCLLDIGTDGLSLLIEIGNDSSLHIDDIESTVALENKAPALLKNFTDIYLPYGENVSLNLSEYFFDEDEIIFDTNAIGISLIPSIDRDILTMNSARDAVENVSVFIYASDGRALTKSNVFIMHVGISPHSPNISSHPVIEKDVLDALARDGQVRVIFRTAKPVDIIDVEETANGNSPFKKNHRAVDKNLVAKEFPKIKDLDVPSMVNKSFISNTDSLIEVMQDIDGIYSVIVHQSSLDALSDLGIISNIAIDATFNALIAESMNITGITAVQNLNFSGSGKKICILDTGIDYDALGMVLDESIHGIDIVNNDHDPMDDNGHGTSVAYIIKNVAPNSIIYAVKVLDSQGTGYESDVLAGLQYCLDNHVDIISFSIGSGLSEGFCDTNIVANKSNQAVDLGIYVVAATGNDGNSTHIRAPSCGSKVTRVAASTKTDGVASISNINSMIDLLAPGQDINTIGLDGNPRTVSGTSYAVPFVTGSAALILENRTLNYSDMTYLLRSTSEIIEYNGIPRNRLNTYNALLNFKTNEPYNYQANQTNATEEPFMILAPAILFASPTSPNNTYTTNSSVTINFSINSSSLKKFIYDWNGTNYTIYDDNLVLMMNFGNISSVLENSTSTFVHDASRYSSNGTCNGMGSVCNWTIGHYGKAISFDGVDDYVDVGNPSQLRITGSITLAAWVMQRSFPTDDASIIDKHGLIDDAGWDLKTSSDIAEGSDRNFTMAVTSSDQDYSARYSNTKVEFDRWYHVVGTYDNNSQTIHIYVNGALDDAHLEGTVPTSQYDASVDVGIGTRMEGGNQFPWDGVIDEVRVWNRSLSAAEVSVLYYSNLNKFAADSWAFTVNQSLPTNGSYMYYGYASSADGSSNVTDYRWIYKGLSPSYGAVNWTKFNGTTTNYSNRTSGELSSLAYAVLEIVGYGRIEWNGAVDARGADFDHNVDILNNSIYVNTANLHSSFNSGANLTINGARYINPVPVKDGIRCADCARLSWTGGNLTFNVSGFSNYTTAENTTLIVWDNNDNATYYHASMQKYANDTIEFFANYTNQTSGLAISDANCTINFSDGATYRPMSYDSTLGIFNLTINLTGSTSYAYTIKCNRTDYAPLIVTDSISTFRYGCAVYNTANINIAMMNNVSIDGAICYDIRASNVTLDCAGHTISGNNTYEIPAVHANSSFVTVKDCIIRSFTQGIYYDTASAANGTIVNNSITTASAYNYDDGIILHHFASNNRVENNTVYIYGNNYYSAGMVFGYYTSYNNVTGNTIIANGTQAKGIAMGSNADGMIFRKNNVYILNPGSGYVMTTDGAYNLVIEYNNFTGSHSYWYGVQMMFGDGHRFVGNRINVTESGVQGLSITSTSSNNIIENNTITSAQDNAVSIESSGNIVSGNNISGTSALYVSGTAANSNLFTNNTLNGSTACIWIVDGSNNTFYWNSIIGSGIWVNNTNLTNKFNTTVSGISQGNFYPNATSYALSDSNGDGWADGGTDYPFNKSKLGYMIWDGYGSDWGPRYTPYPGIKFENPTPTNNTFTTYNSVIINVSMNTSRLRRFIYDWNNTNYSFYDDDLVLMMNFDNVSSLGENDTHVKDFSRYGNNGTTAGISWNSSGKYGGAYQWDGTDWNWIRVEDDPTINMTGTQPFTLAAWVKGYTNGIAAYIVDKGDPPQYRLAKGDDNKLSVSVYDTSWRSASSDAAITNDTWTYVVGVGNGTNLKLYVNGAFQTTASESYTGIAKYGAPFTVGGMFDGNTDWSGLIDEVRIWNRSLSAGEISALYQSNMNKYASDGWSFTVNQSMSINGSYTYYGYVKDSEGNENMTETRILNRVPYTLGIAFESPTLPNNTITKNNTVTVNFSINSSSLRTLTYDWNGTNYTFYDGDLVLMMNFDNVSGLGENNTHFKDFSRFGNNGTCYSDSCNYTTGRYGYAWMGNGSDNDILVVPNSSSLVLSDNFTVSVWVKTTGLTSSHQSSFATKSSYTVAGWELFDNGQYDSFVYFRVNPSVNYARFDRSLVNDGVWHNIVGLYNGSTNVFLDGEWKLSGLGGYSPNNAADLYLGETLDGALDEVRIWNRSLSGAEISLLYKSNLKKHASDGWSFVVNQSIPTNGTYTYYGYAKDSNENENITDLRYLNITNTAAIINTSSISPSSPYADNTLIGYCNATDYDNDALQYYYQWWVDGDVNLSGNGSAGISASKEINPSNISTAWLVKGQSWKLSCMANDGMINSSWLNSTATTIGNSAPVMNLSRMSPTMAYVNASLIGYCNASDVDDDTLTYYYQWWRNGATNVSGNTSSGKPASAEINVNNITSTWLVKYQNWTLSCMANDGTSNSSWLNSTQLTINNSIPLMHNTSLAPSNTTTDYDIIGYCNATDADNDNITYHYQLWLETSLNSSGNTANYSSGLSINAANISTTLLYAGQNWTLSCLGSDGTSNSTWLNSTADHIKNYLQLTFEGPTPSNNTFTGNSTLTFNINITNTTRLDRLVWDWNNTNYSVYDGDLVLMMNFDNVSAIGEGLNNLTADISRYGSNGTCYGMGEGCNYSTGKSGPAIVFNGNAQYIRIDDASSLKPAREITVMAWFKTRQLSDWDGLVEKCNDGATVTDGYSLRFTNTAGAKLYWTLVTTAAVDYSYQPANILDGNWHFLAGSYNSSTNTTKIYYDGALVYTNTTGSTGDIVHNTNPLYIGQGARLGFSREFNGSIDEVKIFNRSLTDAEVINLYHSNLKKYDADKWSYVVNMTDYTSGNYTYYAWAKDLQNNMNDTGIRYLYIGNVIPTIRSSTILPNPGFTTSVLKGYCNATDSPDDNLTYYYVWYRDDAINISGITSQDNIQGVRVNVANISTSNISLGDNWTLSCMANDGEQNSSWLNSSTVTILPDYISLNYTSPTPANAYTLLSDNVLINVSMNVSYLQNFSWDWNGTNYSLYDNSLVLMMNFDNVSALGEGNNAFVYDASQYGNNGTCYNMGDECNYTGGKYGRAISLNASSAQRITIADSSTFPTIGNALTMMLWYKVASNPQTTQMMMMLGTSSSARVEFRNRNISVSKYTGGGTVLASTAPGAAGVWHQIAYTHDGTTNKLYYDGILANYTTVAQTAGVTGLLVFGGNLEDEYFDGDIDEPRIWNRVLTAAEIQQQYESVLYKFSASQWGFLTNKTNLTNGTYTYYAYAISAGNTYNQTEQRTLYAGNFIPLINTSRISPTGMARADDALLGYCNATDTNNDNLYYYYIWYLNGDVNVSGSTGSYSQGQEVNVANISQLNISAGQNWTLGCRPYDGMANGSWMNSSTVTISPCRNLGNANTVNTMASDALNYNGTCFNITASNVTIDCAGYSIIGNNTAYTYGVYTTQYNTTVRDCIIQNFSAAILYNGSTDGLIHNNTVMTAFNGGTGILLMNNSHRINLTKNTVNNGNASGIMVSGGFNVTVDCQGMLVNGTNYTGTSGLYTNQTSTIFRNCLVTNFYDGINFHGPDAKKGLADNITASVSSTGGAIRLNGNGGNNISRSTGTNIWGYGIITEDNLGVISNSIGISATGSGILIQIYGNLRSTTFDNITGISTSGAGITMRYGGNNFLNNSNGTSTSGAGLVLYAGSNFQTGNNTIANSWFSSSTYYAIHIYDANNLGYVQNNTFYNNILTSSSGTLLFISPNSTCNTFFWNNFTAATKFVNDTNGTNFYNTTINGQPEGNIWANVVNGSVQIVGGVNSSYRAGWFAGSGGSGYPYSNSTSLGKLSGYVVDYAPLTNNYGWNPTIAFTLPTPANGTITKNTSVLINISIHTTTLNNFTFNWNGTNYRIFDDDLVFMMNFDNVSSLGEGSNNFSADVSRYGNNGTCHGNTGRCNWVPGKYGSAFNTSSTSSNYITIPDNPQTNLTSEFTISVWINADTPTQWGGIIRKYNSSGADRISLQMDGPSNYRPVLYLNNATGGGKSIVSLNITLGYWYHVVFTFNSSSISSYFNGNYYTSAANTIGTIGTTNESTVIGCQGPGGGTSCFNGSIDELRIYNRSLSAAEIAQLYKSNLNKYAADGWSFISNQSNLSGAYTYYGFVRDTYTLTNQTDTRYLYVQNTAPVMNTSRISPMPSAFTNDTLKGYCNASDADADMLIYYYQWWLNETLNISGRTSQYAAGQEVNVANVSSSQLVGGQNWTLTCKADDGLANSSLMNSTTVNILASVPGQVVLISPSNNDYTVHDRNTPFIWNATASTDYYDINITSNACSDIPKNVSAPTTNYTPSQYLCVASDPGAPYYRWMVRACNNNGCGLWSDMWNFSIEPFMVITMLNDTISLGNLTLLEQKTTLSGSPNPFIFRNDGNVYVDMFNVTANRSLWLSPGAGLGTNYALIMAGNSTQLDSFNNSASAMNWLALNAFTNQTVIALLNFNTSRNTAYIHVNVTVPGDEPVGPKSASIIFGWMQS